jgi:hypothetical protein
MERAPSVENDVNARWNRGRNKRQGSVDANVL